MERSGQERELVYCHQCENEWYRDEHGIICPQCESEFTEVIERDHDPRQPDTPDLPQSFLDGHNPWSVPDPDEEDIDNLNQDDPHMSRRAPYGANRPPPQADDLFNSFRHLIQMVAGPGGIPPDINAQNGRGAGNGAGETHPFRPQSAPGSRTFVRSGPGFSFTYSTTTSFGDGSRTRTTRVGPDGQHSTIPATDLQDFMTQMFGGLGAGVQGGRPGMFGGLFGMPGYTGSFNPGDFATEGGLADIISQMMEQHANRSNAPGPASEAAIASLIKKPATEKDLGINEGQEPTCSICMDNVSVGDEIMVLPCNHWFHPICAREWLTQHDTCPMCRKGIMPEDGSQTARAPDQPPLHNEDPVAVRERQRRESGTVQHPFVIPDSPEAERRPSNHRRTSSANAGTARRQNSSSTNSGGEGTSMLDRLRRTWR